ncbi:recombinase family protein [Maribacter sp. 2304DJ31-5]|uniref:recombinase family protein n=1 Tax=Maribacter sp. 2304DJ31-5 TaxID=3386273 RepID=UPI0039BD4FA9
MKTDWYRVNHLLGYRKGEDGKIEIDPEQAKLIKRIYESSLKGKGSKVIANELSEEGVPTQRNKQFWAGNTILDIIKNPYYKGVRTQSGVEYKVPAIFDEAYWQKVNDNIKNNRIFSGTKVVHKYLLNKGLVCCGVCGKNYYGRKQRNSKYAYYLCASRKSRLEDCHNRALNLEVFERFVWDNFFRNGEMYQRVTEAFKHGGSEKRLAETNTEIQKNEKEINAIKRKISNNYQNFIEEIVDKENYLRAKNSLEAKLQHEMEVQEALKKEQILLQNEERFLSEIRKDIPMPESWKPKNGNNPYFEDWMQRTWDKTLKGGLNLANKGIIDDEMPLSEKKQLIQKYIQKLNVTFHHAQKYFLIEVQFNIPIPNETYMLNNNQDLAANLDNKLIFPTKELIDYSPHPSGQNTLKRYKVFKKKLEKEVGEFEYTLKDILG